MPVAASRLEAPSVVFFVQNQLGLSGLFSEITYQVQG